MAWTAPKTWTVGELVTAANMNTHVRDNLNSLGPSFRTNKAAAETVTGSTVLQDDNHFFWTTPASVIWVVHMSLVVSPSTTGGFKWGWLLPSGGSSERWMMYANSLGDMVQAASGADTGDIGAGDRIVEVRSRITISTTPGTVQFQWAQSSAAGNTVEKTSSVLVAHTVGG